MLSWSTQHKDTSWCFETSTKSNPPTDSAPQLPTKHLLARLNLQPVHIVVVGTRRLNVYCCSAQNWQQNASVTSVIQLTSQMCSMTIRVRWNSSSLRDICPPYRQCLTGPSRQQQQQRGQIRKLTKKKKLKCK